jgi:uncharacterized protein YkwD
VKRAFSILFSVLAGAAILFCIYMAIDASIRTSDTVGIAHEAFDEINKLRAENGLPKLLWDNELERLAIQHSQYMKDTGRFEHSSYPFPYAENIIQSTGGFPSGSSIVTPWRYSSGHYLNMVSSSISRGAVGVVGDYATFMGR